MSAPTRAPAAIDALVALAEGLPALEGVAISDGQTLDGGTAKDRLCIGWDGNDDGDNQAVASSQEWAGLGAKAKDESLIITCAVIAGTGNGDVKPMRDRAYEILGAFADGLRADPSLGFPPPTLAALRVGDLFQEQTDRGPEARVVFQVGVQTRI